MSKVILSGYILVPPSDLVAVAQALPKHSALTQAESGCLVFDVSPNASDPCRFDVHEEFVDRAAFDAHQARVKASEWGEITRNVQRFYQLQE